MIYYQRHIKGVSFLLVILMLSQSCLVYRKCPSIEKYTNSKKNTLLKIYTTDGKKYKVRWIEEHDGNIYSITKIKKVYIKKESLREFRHNPELFDIEDRGDYIYGLEMITHDTSTVLIPTDQVEKIKKFSTSGTIAANASILLGAWGAFAALALWALSS